MNPDSGKNIPMNIPIRKKHDTDTQVGVGTVSQEEDEPVPVDCEEWDYEMRVEGDHWIEGGEYDFAKDFYTQLKSLGRKHWVTAITEYWETWKLTWTENACLPGIQLNLQESSHELHHKTWRYEGEVDAVQPVDFKNPGISFGGKINIGSRNGPKSEGTFQIGKKDVGRKKQKGSTEDQNVKELGRRLEKAGEDATAGGSADYNPQNDTPYGEVHNDPIVKLEGWVDNDPDSQMAALNKTYDNKASKGRTEWQADNILGCEFTGAQIKELYKSPNIDTPDEGIKVSQLKDDVRYRVVSYIEERSFMNEVQNINVLYRGSSPIVMQMKRGYYRVLLKAVNQ